MPHDPEAYHERYSADPCPCGHRGCKAWHVWPAAAVQGVRFTERQAKAVTELLNNMSREQGQ